MTEKLVKRNSRVSGNKPTKICLLKKKTNKQNLENIVLELSVFFQRNALESSWETCNLSKIQCSMLKKRFWKYQKMLPGYQIETSRNLICINMFFKQFFLLVYFLILKYCLEFSETFCIKHFDEIQYRL